MTKCCMTGKNIRCPECDGNNVSFLYDVNFTIIYCQNMKRENQCNSIGKYGFKSYHYSDKNYPKVIEKCSWNLNSK